MNRIIIYSLVIILAIGVCSCGEKPIIFDYLSINKNGLWIYSAELKNKIIIIHRKDKEPLEFRDNNNGIYENYNYFMEDGDWYEIKHY